MSNTVWLMEWLIIPFLVVRLILFLIMTFLFSSSSWSFNTQSLFIPIFIHLLYLNKPEVTDETGSNNILPAWLTFSSIMRSYVAFISVSTCKTTRIFNRATKTILSTSGSLPVYNYYRKNPLQPSHVIALKWYPVALSPHTKHTFIIDYTIYTLYSTLQYLL